MNWDKNFYYYPEASGLTIIGQLDDPHACYSFDYLVVWQHNDGRLFWGTDSGCSCPSPFEERESLDDLTPLTDESWAEFSTAVWGHCWDEYVQRAYNEDTDPLAADKTQLLQKVALLLRG